uniref:Uncharacterized protein n=1 Tax=Pavo cristatus TaxID=9049 RepID=A0A8C9F773_PAVCR
MLQWLCGKLPWEHNLKDPVAGWHPFWNEMLNEDLGLHQVKFTFEMHSAGELSKFLVCVYGLAYDEKPKYQELKNILLDGLKMSGTPYDGPLEFPTVISGLTGLAVKCQSQHSSAFKLPVCKSPVCVCDVCAVRRGQGAIHF